MYINRPEIEEHKTVPYVPRPPTVQPEEHKPSRPIFLHLP
jgi:hypothetical protein